MKNFVYLSQFLDLSYGQSQDKISLDKTLKIYGFSPLNETKKQTISWSASQDIEWADIQASVLICPLGTIKPDFSEIILVQTEKPRKLFAEWLSFFVDIFAEKTCGIENTAIVHPDSKVHATAYVGHYAVVEANVEIGANSFIGHHSVIGSETLIGKNVFIKSHCVIGDVGFGFEKNDQNVPIRIPHIGWVEISDNAEIGSFTTVCRGTLGATKIHDNVKIDDHVHVAHNVTIKDRTMLIAFAMIGGSTVIGEDTWIAPGSIIRDGLDIGSNVTVGMGAVVTKDIKNDLVLIGNPARALKPNDNN
jgi:UDP-3-O-[3-hydroxymyristoyl] glucosamine N-acyltransferase